MDSPQSVVSPFKNLIVFAEAEKQNLDLFTRNPNILSREAETFLGVLEVYIHQARDIHNICIYQKQDVYAKLCLTNDPEKAVSTQIINGGGQNPVFNENVRLKVQTIESSLKCEIWMLSRVRNYLEDQLLGFALVPLSEVLFKNGKLENEFSLSSTDLFHSPAGFVQLSLSYNGTSPEVMAISAMPISNKAIDETGADADLAKSVRNYQLDKIEFPDPKIMNENHLMVSEYFGISSDSVVSSDTENEPSSEIGGPVGNNDSVENLKHDSPPSSVSTNGVSSESSETPRASSKSPNTDYFSTLKEKTDDAESDASGGLPSSNNTFAKPLVTVDIEPEQKVVQQDFVDLYMKSMQQFTESLAKMKLPMDMESKPTSSGNSASDQKLPTPKSAGSRVFYGSRAFF